MEKRKEGKLYWVVLRKTAGVAVRAMNEEDAQLLAYDMDEAEYEYDQFEWDEWAVDNVEEITEEQLGEKWEGI